MNWVRRGSSTMFETGLNYKCPIILKYLKCMVAILELYVYSKNTKIDHMKKVQIPGLNWLYTYFKWSHFIITVFSLFNGFLKKTYQTHGRVFHQECNTLHCFSLSSECNGYPGWNTLSSVWSAHRRPKLTMRGVEIINIILFWNTRNVTLAWWHMEVLCYNSSYL